MTGRRLLVAVAAILLSGIEGTTAAEELHRFVLSAGANWVAPIA